MISEIDPYATLGVSPDATIDEIKDAYRRAARRLHPDSNRHNPGAVVQFQDITAAYEILTKPERRRMLDDTLRARVDNSLGFTLRVTPSKRNLPLLSEAQVVYMLAEIHPDPRASASREEIKEQTHLNLTLVLDRSNSMNEGRLERVQYAAHKIIDQLSSNDVLSVVAFNDHAEVIIPATTVSDKSTLKARISMLKAFGGTEIYRGMLAGVEQNRKYLAPRLVNHIILLTDGNTYGDQERCLTLAEKIAVEGISLSAMGLGEEWNDQFLDQLASTTGGTSLYIRSSNMVVRFLNEHVRSLSNCLAERLQLSVAPDADIHLESAFKLMPSPQPLETSAGFIPLGSLQINRMTSVLLQLELPANLSEGYRSIARIVAVGDVLSGGHRRVQALSDVSLGISRNPPQEASPPEILDALGRLTLYRMQERAQEALDQGNVQEATRRLQNLATRLLEMGEHELAQQAVEEIEQVAYTNNLSAVGRKTLKYQTRHLLLGSSTDNAPD